jgi:hypothetical protein
LSSSRSARRARTSLELTALGSAPLLKCVRARPSGQHTLAAVQCLAALTATHANVGAHVLRLGGGVVLKELFDLSVSDDLVLQVRRLTPPQSTVAPRVLWVQKAPNGDNTATARRRPGGERIAPWSPVAVKPDSMATGFSLATPPTK